MQSPQPRQYLTSTMFGSDSSIRIIAFMGHDLAALQILQCSHLSGVMNAYKTIQRFHKGLSRFLNLIIRAAAEMPNKQASDIIFNISNEDTIE